MFTKTKTVLAAAFILGSASAVFAQSGGEELQNSDYLRKPNAGVPLFMQAMKRDHVLVEGRNVGVRIAPSTWTSVPNPIESFGGY